jgi:hypothetical protein
LQRVAKRTFPLHQENRKTNLDSVCKVLYGRRHAGSCLILALRSQIYHRQNCLDDMAQIKVSLGLLLAIQHLLRPSTKAENEHRNMRNLTLISENTDWCIGAWREEEFLESLSNLGSSSSSTTTRCYLSQRAQEGRPSSATGLKVGHLG